jgi:tetratricopeptide (TPR) repeat protein
VIRGLVALLLLSAGVAAAQPDPDERDFHAAEAQAAAGDHAAAIAAFEALVTRAPDGPWADDALAEAMRTAEDAGDLAAARRLGEQLLAAYPSSRLARRVRAHLDAMARDVGIGDRWLAVAAERDAILRAAAGKRDPSDEVHRMEALVLAQREFPAAGDAAMWIGDTWRRLGRLEAARRWYAQAQGLARDDLARWRARKAEADVLAAATDFDAAAAIYRSLRGQGDRIADRALDVAEDELAVAVARHRRLRWAYLALAVIAIGAIATLRRDAGSWRAAGRVLVRPPAEAIFLLPAAGILVAISQAGNRLVADAVLVMAIGGLAITWISGVVLDAARRRGPVGRLRIAGHVAAIVVAVLALVYLSLMQQRLLDMLVETWKHGHDLQ